MQQKLTSWSFGYLMVHVTPQLLRAGWRSMIHQLLTGLAAGIQDQDCLVPALPWWTWKSLALHAIFAASMLGSSVYISWHLVMPYDCLCFECAHQHRQRSGEDGTCLALTSQYLLGLPRRLSLHWQ